MSELESLQGIEAGTQLPEFVRRTDLGTWNRYAAVNDEFVPLHMDHEAAKAAGQKDVFGMGNLRLAYLHCLLHGWLGGRGEIAELSCQFRGLNFKDDVLTSRGRVRSVERVEGGRIVELALSVENQAGEETTPGTGSVILLDGDRRPHRLIPAPEAPSERRLPGVYLEESTLGWIGKSTAPVVSYPVGANDIRRWALAVYHPEAPPVEFRDPQAAEELVAPRDFNPFAWLRLGRVRIPWFRPVGVKPGSRVLNGGQRNRYFAPIRAGDVITQQSCLADAYEKEGRLGTMLFLVSEARWTNQTGELVRIGSNTTIYY